MTQYVVLLDTNGHTRVFGTYRRLDKAEDAAKSAFPRGRVVELEHPGDMP